MGRTEYNFLQARNIATITLANADDSTTNALMAISYGHHEIHSGSAYFIDSATDLAINNVLDLQFTTPDTTKWTHLTFKLDSESETEWFIYEGATIETAGTTITPINNNRNSSNTSGNTVAWITNTSVSNANDDTVVSGATLIANGVVGSGRDAGHDSRNNEIILKQNTIYCFRAVATSAGYVDFKMQWYEHTDK